ncbi:MAG: hypothetical protein WBN09_06410 [Woeseiaceae bacterium]
MTKLNKFGAIIVAALCVFIVVACGKKEEAASAGILQFIPAESPYVMAMLDEWPEEITEKMEPQLEEMLEAYRVVIRESVVAQLDAIPEGSDDKQDAEKAKAVIEELISMLSPEGFAEIGIDKDSRIAFYGNGLLPVLRISVSDPALFDAAIKRLEEKAGHTMDTASLDGNTYRYIGDEDGRLILGMFGNYFVATIAPDSFDDEQLKRVVGLTLPQKSMAKSGELAAIAKEYGFTKHFAYLIDTKRLAEPFLGAPSGLDVDFLQLLEYDAAELSDVCREEFRGLTEIAPRMVAGYTTINADRVDSTLVVEMRKDIAAGLKTFAAPVAGLGTDSGSLVSFGMSFDLLAIRSYYEAQLDKLEADPFKCEAMAELQAGVASGREALNQPVPPIVYDIRGFNAVIDDVSGFDLASSKPPENVDATLLLAVKNAPALLNLGAMFSPEIAALNLQPDGKAVEFTPKQLAGQIDSLFVALNDNALSLSIGEGASGDAAAILKAPASEKMPFMSLTMDAERYYALMGDAMMVSPDVDGEEMSPEAREAMRKLMVIAGTMYDRLSVDMMFTDRGVELESTVILGDGK